MNVAKSLKIIANKVQLDLELLFIYLVSGNFSQ